MNMNIKEAVDKNVVWDRLFPNGLNEPVFIEPIRINLGQRMELKLHTKQKPDIEIEKWGKWGVDYNVIIIELNAFCHDIDIKNWKEKGYGELSVQLLNNDNSGDPTFLIVHSSPKSTLKIECNKLHCQGCSRYLSHPERYYNFNFWRRDYEY